MGKMILDDLRKRLERLDEDADLMIDNNDRDQMVIVGGSAFILLGKLTRATPVSYTHLDVYKRQGHHRHLCVCAGVCSHPDPRKNQGAEFLPHHFLHPEHPVCGRDVYKRQAG